MSSVVLRGAAIVTGAGRGFGKAIAMRLAREGFAAALTGRSEAQLADVAAEINAAGGRAIAIATDVTDRAAATRVVNEAERQLGAITLLVNNAGVPGPFGPLWLGVRLSHRVSGNVRAGMGAQPAHSSGRCSLHQRLYP